MAIENNLMWFSTEGDYLNYKWNTTTQRWEGSMIFDLNSSDTFKSINTYMFERVAGFNYQDPGQLYLQKMQIFNSYGFTIRGSTYSGLTQFITMIQPAIIDPTFYSKWLYGQNFEALYPIGTKIIFNYPLLEFTNTSIPYTVIDSMKGAILILSGLDNQTFESNYGPILGLTSTYATASISSISTIGIYNYVDSSLIDNLPSWSEPNFYDQLFVNQKLNLVNTSLNQSTPIVTVDSVSIPDDVYSRFDTYGSNLPQNTPLTIELILKTKLPVIYTGGMSINQTNITFLNSFTTSYIRPGNTVTIQNSLLNQLDYQISNVPTFTGTNTLTFYATSSQTIWNNQIFQCVQAYTQGATSGINPNNSTYWTSSITYIPIIETLNSETILNGQLYLTTNKLYFTQSFTVSGTSSIALAVTNYAKDFNEFDIDLYFNGYNRISAQLNQPGQWAQVNYYAGLTPASASNITTFVPTYEKVIGIEENLTTEDNQNISNNYSYNLVFDAIDEYGIIIFINKLVYQQSAVIFYEVDGVTIDIPRSVDATLRQWLITYYPTLITLGIYPILSYVGNVISPYYNTIQLVTEYPNVPLLFTVQVGTEAIFTIQHSTVLFYTLGGFLNITVNGNAYGVTTSYVSLGVPNVPATLSQWILTYSLLLASEGIIVTSYNSLLEFRIAKQSTLINYTISTGQGNLSSLPQYKITTIIPGNTGAIITSNSIDLPSNATYSFDDAGFSTGMLVAINNSLYTLENQQYNILYMQPDILILSYQGPFWGTTSGICLSSPFTDIAFSLGYGSTGCTGTTGSTSSTNTYTVNTYNSLTNLVDIVYLPLSQEIYALGDGIQIIDGTEAVPISTIYLGNPTSSSIKLGYNSYNSLLYALTTGGFYAVDPSLYTILQTVTFSSVPGDINFNTQNGDVYISYPGASKVNIYNQTGSFITSVTTSSGTEKLAWDPNDGMMYVSQNNGNVIRISGTTRTIISTYPISGLTYSLFYESITDSVYAFGSNITQIYNGVLTPISLSASNTFNDMIFDNLSGYFYISRGFTSSFSEVNPLTNGVNWTTSLPYGQMALNNYDSDIYITSTNSVSVISYTGSVVHSFPFTSSTTQPVFDPIRQSIWFIQPGANSIVEIEVILNGSINPPQENINYYYQNQLGTLSPYYTIPTDIWLSTTDFIRAPRENFTGGVTVSFIWKWMSDSIPEIFLYDFSGSQLEPFMGIASYSYTGALPLNPAWLNSTPNSNLSYVQTPQLQQTVFSQIEYGLDFIDSTTDFSFMPSPFEIFIGFNSPNEGPIGSTLQLFKHEPISVEIPTTSTNGNNITFEPFTDMNGNSWTQISLGVNSTNTFTQNNSGNSYGFNIGQLLQLTIQDTTNTTNQYLSPNNGKIFQISQIYSRIILLTASYTGDIISTESTIVSNYPTSGVTTYLSTTFNVIDKEIGRFSILGQTEIEDIRYKIALTNVGKNITPNETFIFKTYDINEQGVDWVFLNQKRKEMLIVKSQIFPYVGSYKAIVNAINYFGYNDLQLNEYYRNINIDSSNYNKLYRVPIQDIFNTQVVGFTSQDALITTMPNKNYESTNLLNLTYDITDINGNDTLLYSFQEVLIKLNGLKKWLESNVIPLPFEVYDITGQAYFPSQTSIVHRTYRSEMLNITSNMTPINFNINRTYLLPINSGSTIYTVMVDFTFGSTSSYSNLYLNSGITHDELPDYFTVQVRTYQTNPTWNAFSVYSVGNRVSYYNLIYQSAISNNSLNDPRQYQNSPLWNNNTNYLNGQITMYNQDIWIYTGTQSSFATQSYTSSTTYNPPDIDPRWDLITIWKQVQLAPVQTIKEFRSMGLSMSATQSFSFTIDSNIDPLVSIQVNSDNGYGGNYMVKKNYQIIGYTTLTTPTVVIDKIGPFTPISPI